ncbi:kinase-like domain-containing protein [Apiosordaria backusii]|uniref:EKC/KEOPS complex subunit BUD32 n=1 Tax=Apiosordaria backusii TaxID=314023 RepID=A0AA40A0N7_9PEZI|nr:kinase-like domain-containing protein [Apiosordaria backusii]
MLARQKVEEEALHKVADRSSFNIKGWDYRPAVQQVLHHSKSAVIARLKPGVVLKHSRYDWWNHPESMSSEQVKDARHAFTVELAILRHLGEHPRTIQQPQGLLFAEAEFGSLQSYIDDHFHSMSAKEKMAFRLQASEAIAFIHSKGIIHSDLRPDNFLVCSGRDGTRSLRLCDFGGSTYGDLDGGHLPDAGFFDPRKPWVATGQTDIFALASVLYTIMTGHWPHRERGDERDLEQYRTDVDQLFEQSVFPPVVHLEGGEIIYNAWTDGYNDAKDIVRDHERVMAIILRDGSEEDEVDQDGMMEAQGQHGMTIWVAGALVVGCLVAVRFVQRRDS